MHKSYKRFYLLSLAGVLIASFYPIYMGVIVISDYIKNAWIDVANYPKYIIPYTPISISLIIMVVFLPVIFKLFKRYALLAASVLGIGLFFAGELFFENMVVMDGMTKVNIESWQLMSCIATPETWKTIGNPLIAQYSPAFKIHFYIISIVIILAVLNVLYGFASMIIKNRYDKKRPLIAQAISAVIFIGLCILACFTAFFRNGTINISPLSATLMSVFFIVFGVTFGVYTGSFFYGKRTILWVTVPSILAMIATVVMYFGELVLMGGVLFKYGKGFIFEPIGLIPFAAIDIAIICISGFITFFILGMMKKHEVTNYEKG